MLIMVEEKRFAGEMTRASLRSWEVGNLSRSGNGVDKQIRRLGICSNRQTAPVASGLACYFQAEVLFEHQLPRNWSVGRLHRGLSTILTTALNR